MKKILLSLTLASTMVFAVSCGDDKGEEEGGEEGDNTEAAADSGEEEEAPAGPMTGSISLDESYVTWESSMPEVEGKVHTGKIKFSSGEITVDASAGAPALTAGSFTFDIGSIFESDLTAETGLTNLVGHLSSADFFALDSLGAPSFTITSVGEGSITGELTMRGVTQTIDVPATVSFEADAMTATTGDFEVDFTQYGMPFFAQDKEEKVLAPAVKLSVTIVAYKPEA